ncbi:hypothetical protein H4R24_005670 [Coemansia sp. RSA 988]|nr:hypothetical protein H4R24_005670 [Coemansia sp. RSA 988]
MRFFKSAAFLAIATVAAAAPLAVRGSGYSTDAPAPGGNLPIPGGNLPIPGGDKPAPDGGDDTNECGVSKDNIAALKPLLQKLRLDETVDGVKQLAEILLGGVGGVLTGPVSGLVGGVTGLVAGITGININLDGTLDAVANLLDTQVPCLLDTVARK